MADPQPPLHDAAKDILTSVGTWIMWGISAVVSASLTAFQQATTIKVAVYWVMLSVLVGFGLAIVSVVYWGANVFVGTVLCIGVGLMIIGIARQLERLNRRVGDASLNIPMLPPEAGIVTPEKPPTPPAIPQEPKQ